MQKKCKSFQMTKKAKYNWHSGSPFPGSLLDFQHYIHWKRQINPRLTVWCLRCNSAAAFLREKFTEWVCHWRSLCKHFCVVSCGAPPLSQTFPSDTNMVSWCHMCSMTRSATKRVSLQRQIVFNGLLRILSAFMVWLNQWLITDIS